MIDAATVSTSTLGAHVTRLDTTLLEQETSEPISEGKEPKSLKERVTTYFGMCAGGTALTACIVGVVASFIFNCPYLAIVFGVGGLASTYAIYLAYVNGQLQGLEEANKNLSRNNKVYEENNAELRQEIAEVTSERERIAAERAKFENENENLSRNNKNLSRNNKVYEENNAELRQEIAEVTSERERIAAERAKFENENKTYSEENTKLRESVENLELKIEGIEEATLALTELAIDGKIDQETLRKILSQIKDSKLVEKLGAFANALNTESVKKLLQKHEELEKKITQLEGVIEGLNEARRDFGVHNQTLGNHVVRLEKHAQTFDTAAKTLDTISNSPLVRELSQSALTASPQSGYVTPTEQRSPQSGYVTPTEQRSPQKSDPRSLIEGKA